MILMSKYDMGFIFEKLVGAIMRIYQISQKSTKQKYTIRANTAAVLSRNTSRAKKVNSSKKIHGHLDFFSRLDRRRQLL